VPKNFKLYFSFLPFIMFSILLSYVAYLFVDFRISSIEQYLLNFAYGDLVNFDGVILSPLSQILYMPYKFLDQDQFLVINTFTLALLVYTLHLNYINKFGVFDIRFLTLASFVNGFLFMLILDNVYFIPFLLLVYYLFLNSECFSRKSDQFLFAYSLFVNPIVLFFVEKFTRRILGVVTLTILTIFIAIVSVGSLDVLTIFFLDFSWIKFAQYTMLPISILYIFSKILKSSLNKTRYIFISTLILLLLQNSDLSALVFYSAITSMFMFHIFLKNKYHPNGSKI